jgi:predicted MFS family arabinose efflux permease
LCYHLKRKNYFKEKNKVPELNEAQAVEIDNNVTSTPDSTAALGTAKRSPANFFTTIVSPLRVRDFRLLFSGQATSTMGDAFYAVALPLIILKNGGSPQELGFVLAAYGVPRLITILIGGLLSDRFRPRWVMLIADIARALLLGLMAFEVAGGHVSLSILTITVAGLGLFAGLFIPASYSILPDILPKSELQAGNALNSSLLQVATLVGSAVAGIVIARLQSQTALFFDAITFFVSAITLAAMRRRPIVVSAPPSEKSTSEESAPPPTVAVKAKDLIPEGMTFGKFLRTSRLFQVTIMVVTISFFTSGGLIGVALPAYALGPLAVGASGYGLILAIFGGGELVGGLIAGGLGNLPHRAAIVLLLQILQGMLFVILPLFGGIVWVAVVLAFVSLLNGLMNIIYFTLIQEKFPNKFMGRIWGIVTFATFGLYPLSVALGGLVIARWGFTFTFQVCGIALAVAGIIGLLQREIRELE